MGEHHAVMLPDEKEGNVIHNSVKVVLLVIVVSVGVVKWLLLDVGVMLNAHGTMIAVITMKYRVFVVLPGPV